MDLSFASENSYEDNDANISFILLNDIDANMEIEIQYNFNKDEISKTKRGGGNTRARGQHGKRRGGRGRGGRQKGETKKMKDESDRLMKLHQDREIELTNRINGMSEADVKKILFETIKRQPGLIFSLLNEGAIDSVDTDKRKYPTWCKCTHCKEMPTLKEKICCNKVPDHCISKLAEMECIITEPSFLSLCNSYRDDVFCLEEEEDSNKSYRHGAYRQFIIWTYQYLGANNRKVIPSCCVWKIRDKFPSLIGNYTGFKADRLA